MSTLSPPASQGCLTGRVPSPLSTHTKTAGPLLMTGWYSSSWKARSLEYGEGGGFPPPFSYATKQSGGDKTHRPPDTAARLRPTKQPVCFTTERAVCDIIPCLADKSLYQPKYNPVFYIARPKCWSKRIHSLSASGS